MILYISSGLYIYINIYIYIDNECNNNDKSNENSSSNTTEALGGLMGSEWELVISHTVILQGIS